MGGFADTPEMMTLYNSLESFSLGNPDNIDELPFLKNINTDDITELLLVTGFKTCKLGNDFLRRST
jgi:hypothetical protein